jgi:short-subunit dehydrogenase
MVRRYALLGGTKGMGRSLARLLAGRGDQLALLGRDPAELERSAADLRARGAGDVATFACDLLERGDPPGSAFERALEAAELALGGLDVVVVTAGMFATQENLESDPVRLAMVLDANFAGTVLFCEAARKRLLARGGGTLCVFSSVAGDRGRKPIALYGATKAGLSHYLESLDHRHHRDGLKVVVVKPGFVRTQMTAGLPEPPFAGDPDAVARRVLRALDAGRPVVYAPAPWALVMAVIRRLPRFVMRRVGF